MIGALQSLTEQDPSESGVFLQFRTVLSNPIPSALKTCDFTGLPRQDFFPNTQLAKMAPFNELAESRQQQTATSPDEKYQEVEDSRTAGDHRESDAARTLQRTYRGHRERRQLKGITLDPATRWTEV